MRIGAWGGGIGGLSARAGGERRPAGRGDALCRHTGRGGVRRALSHGEPDDVVIGRDGVQRRHRCGVPGVVHRGAGAAGGRRAAGFACGVRSVGGDALERRGGGRPQRRAHRCGGSIRGVGGAGCGCRGVFGAVPAGGGERARSVGHGRLHVAERALPVVPAVEEAADSAPRFARAVFSLHLPRGPKAGCPVCAELRNLANAIA